MSYFHVRLTVAGQRRDEVKLDLDEGALEQQFLRPYREGRPIMITGRAVAPDEIQRLRISRSELSAQALRTLIEVRDRSDPVGVIGAPSMAERIAARASDVSDEYVLGPPGYQIPELDQREAAPAPALTLDERVVAAVLVTDIVGSTEQLREIGDEAWKHQLDAHRVVVRQQLATFGGREIDTAGDGFLATFHAPAQAVRCALAIRDTNSRLGLRVRSGVHFGEVEQSGQAIVGIAVHMSSRINEIAEPGEVLVSRTVVDLVQGSGITFADRGNHALKGIHGEQELFGVT